LQDWSPALRRADAGDFVPRRFAKKVNEEVTVLNAVTARSPENAKWPFVLESDRACLQMALTTVPERSTGPVIVYVRDTLELGRASVSETALTLLRSRDDVAATGPAAPLRWAADDLAHRSTFRPGSAGSYRGRVRCWTTP